MKSIKIIHIGDIHYPESSSQKAAIDKKDDGFNSGFVNKLAPVPFVEVGKKLADCLENDDIDAILFSGDLTSVGDLEQYEKCVSYFNNLISNIESNIDRKFDVHVVPGNHDLKRKGLKTNDLNERFDDFKKVWTSAGRDILAAYTPRCTELRKMNFSLKIISLNTCSGCGEEYKKLPQKIFDAYKKLLEDSEEDETYTEQFYERIDTPAIYSEHINEIEKHVKDCDDSSISLILGHHAILPQSRPRIDIYTELINSGNVRMALTSLRKPIIYCHGHIHDDPIEIISQPNIEDSDLVLISAPEYKSGFNVIEIMYTESGHPVGIEIHPQRVEIWGGIRSKESIRVPIRQPERMMKYCDINTENVYKLLGAFQRFEDFRKLLETEGIKLSEPELVNILEELEWLRGINIANKSSGSFRSWHIGRIGL